MFGPEQRRADALVALCNWALDDGGLGEVGGVGPHVTVVVPLETLYGRPGAPPAVLDRGGAVSADTARAPGLRQRGHPGGHRRTVSAGRRRPGHRVVTTAQRKALAVPDRGCVGCRPPVAWCQAHHIRHWMDGGPTDLKNLILVCWRCHHNIHERRWKPIRAPDGRWGLHPPPLRQ